MQEFSSKHRSGSLQRDGSADRSQGDDSEGNSSSSGAPTGPPDGSFSLEARQLEALTLQSMGTCPVRCFRFPAVELLSHIGATSPVLRPRALGGRIRLSAGLGRTSEGWASTRGHCSCGEDREPCPKPWHRRCLAGPGQSEREGGLRRRRLGAPFLPGACSARGVLGACRYVGTIGLSSVGCQDMFHSGHSALLRRAHESRVPKLSPWACYWNSIRRRFASDSDLGGSSV